MTAVHAPEQTSARQAGWSLTRRWWVVVLCAVIGAGLAAGAVFALPQRTIGTTTMLVDIPVEASDTEALVRTVESLVTTPAVLNDLAGGTGVDLGPSAIEDALTVERATGSAVIEVSVIDSSEEQVRAISEQVVPVIVARLEATEATTTGATPGTEPGGGSIPLTVVPFGSEPYVRDYSWSLVPTTVLGGLAGGIVGVLIVVIGAVRRFSS